MKTYKNKQDLPYLLTTLKKNQSIFKSCKTKHETLEKLEHFLNETYSPLILQKEILKKFDIPLYKFSGYLDSGEFPTIKIGSRTILKTSCFTELVYNKYKKIFDDKYE